MRRTLRAPLALFLGLLLFAAQPAASAADSLGDRYLEAWCRFFPTRATEAGRHDFDQELEDFSPARRQEWIEFNQRERLRLRRFLSSARPPFERMLDAEALLAQVERELHSATVLHRAERDPLYWSGTIANATVVLLVRDDLPLAERQKRARARAALLPRFARQAQENFRAADPAKIAPELCRIAAGQLRASAEFYRSGFPQAVGSEAEGLPAATALETLAAQLDELTGQATGSPRLGADYAQTFRLGTGVQEPVAAVLARATTDLARKRREAAEYGRKVWPEILPNESMPEDETALLRRLFQEVANDHDTDIESYVARWQANVQEVEAFVRARKIMTLPDPLTLLLERSPAYFVGQSVGGVYPSGPYAPEAKTILFLPMPSPKADEAARAAFFRDFNRAFNRMIVPHELIPGHYVQLKLAARHPHKVRAVFPDPIYVEGWGTFCERLLLDQGWGGARPRLAHLKKQLENIARTIVDIRVHTQEISHEEVLRFAREEALQDEQFAANLWTRTITTSPQITTYYLGYARVQEVFEAAQKRDLTRFHLHRFMDGMMELGPVRLEHYLARAREGRL